MFGPRLYNKTKSDLNICAYKKISPSSRKGYFLANEIFMAFVCVILKPCNASRAAPAWTSFSNSTKAMSWRPGTRRTSLNPGNLNTQQHNQPLTNTEIRITKYRKGAVTDWLKSMDSISSFVSSGRLVRKRMWFGGFSATWEDKGREMSQQNPQR